MLQQKYKEFEERWELTNRVPAKIEDPVITISKVVLTIGSAVLAGSRTGAVIANLNVLTDFGTSLGLKSDLWKVAEALLGFSTVEVSIFLAGYLQSTLSDEDTDKWYKILLYCGIGTSLIANVYPAFNTVSPQVAEIAKIVVNLTVGIAAPVMLFVTGKVSGQLKRDLTKQFNLKLGAWEESKKQAWVRSKEYKTLSTQIVKEKVQVSNQEQSLLSKLNGSEVSIQTLTEVLGKTESEVSELVFSLESKNLITRNNQNIKKLS
jgi:DNA-binding MarR family transcriptional regulator